MDLADARRAFDQRLAMTLGVALYSRDKVRPGGTLLFVGGTRGRRPGVGLAISSTLMAALPALTANLALELAPIRVNLIGPRLRRHSALSISTLRSARSAAQRAARQGPHKARRRPG